MELPRSPEAIKLDKETIAGVPRGMLYAAFALIIASIVLAYAGKHYLPSNMHTDEQTLVASRAIRFVDALDGAVLVYDNTTNEQIYRVPPGSGGFVRGSMRSLARGRHQRGVGADVPFYLIEWQNGIVTLDDSTTGSHIVLNAFGHTNLDAFAILLPQNAPARIRAEHAAE
jgi:putative photosynthetic complex assembly protein